MKKVKPDNSKTIYVGGIYEVDKTSGGSVTRTVTYYPVAGAMRINSTLYYTLKDHLGSASVVTDASGNILGENRYYPYGETRLTTGTIFTDKLFTGQREMVGLAIYHYNARFYSPKLGRFLSPDTIVPGPANPQAFNRYSYVLGNPLKYTDPTGHSQCQTQEDCEDMGTTPMGSGGNGGNGGGGGGRDGCRHNDPDCRGDEGGSGISIDNGNHYDDEWWENLANMYFPAVASGSKVELYGILAFFGGKSWGYTLITTPDGDLQLFYESGLAVTIGPNVSGNLTDGIVFGLETSADYEGPAVSGTFGGMGFAQAWKAKPGRVWGLDGGVSLGLSIGPLSGGRTIATPLEGWRTNLDGSALFACRMAGMCGR